MSLWHDYTLGAIDMGGAVLHGTDTHNENPQVRVEQKLAVGRQTTSRSQTVQIEPQITFTTVEIKKALAILFPSAGAIGVKIGTPVVLYWTKRNEVSHSTDPDHLLTTVNEGIIYPTTLSYNDGFWELEVTILPYTEDGSIDTFVYGTGNLPTFVEIAETYQGGRVSVDVDGGGLAEIDCWQDVTLDFGVNAEQKFHKGLPYPTRAQINTVQPFMTLTNLNPADRARFGIYGSRIQDFELALRQHSNTDGEIPIVQPDTELAHILIHGQDGIVHPEATSGQVGESTTQGLRLGFDENATTAVLTPEYDVAIPALP